MNIAPVKFACGPIGPSTPPHGFPNMKEFHHYFNWSIDTKYKVYGESYKQLCQKFPQKPWMDKKYNHSIWDQPSKR